QVTRPDGRFPRRGEVVGRGYRAGMASSPSASRPPRSRQLTKTPEEAIAEWPTRKRLLVGIPMLLIALTVWLGIPTYFTWKALSGEPATAYVERCDERNGETVCYGTWRTETGQPGSGRIDGAFSSDVGAERRVWVTGDS